MNSKADNKILNAVLTAVFAFMGLFSFTMMFMQPLLADSGYYEPTAVLIFEAASSVILSAAFIFIRKAWIAWLIPVASAAGLLMAYGKEIIYGFGVIINDIIDSTAEYFDTEMYFIDMTESMVRDAVETEAVYMFIVLLAGVYSFCISRKKPAIVPLIITVLSMYPLVIGRGPSGIFIMLTIAYCVMMVIIMSSGMKNGPSFACSSAVAAVMGAVLMAASFVAGKIAPEDTFERSGYFERLNESCNELYEKYQKGELAINHIEQFFIDLFDINVNGGGNSLPGPSGKGNENGRGIKSGSLGRVDELIFTGEEVMSVVTVPTGKPLYLKEYVGMEYRGSSWKEPGEDEEYIKLADNGIHSQDFTGRYLDDVSMGAWFPMRKTSMHIDQNGKEGRCIIMPLYPLVGYDVSYVADEGYKDSGSREYIDYYDIDESVLPLIDYFSEYGNGGVEWEKKYRDYAYSHYLDVNTPMAGELKDMWGGMDSSTAQDRYDTACAVRDYLAANCSYTTHPGKVPAGKDFVEYFLKETHEGYCTYFATSAVMMLRSAGIPARYVEGYLSDTNNATDTDEELDVYETGNGSTREQAKRVSVKDSDAHAWVEYYVDGVGWVDFDVTPAAGRTVSETEPPTETLNPTEETTTKDSREQTTGTSETKPDSTTENPRATASSSQGGSPGFKFRLPERAVKIILIIISVMAGAGILFVILACRHKTVENRRNRMYDVNVDAKFRKQYVMDIYKDYLRILRHFGYRIKPDETETAYAERVAEKLSFAAGCETMAIASVYENAVFGEEAVDAPGYERMFSAYLNLRRRMYESIGLARKLIYKYILNI